MTPNTHNPVPMMTFQLLDHKVLFERILFATFGKEVGIRSITPCPGGCINNSLILNTAQGSFFLKWNESQDEAFFASEARGLELLADADAIQIPHVIGYGKVEGTAYLLLENLHNQHRATHFFKHLGEQLAQLHSHTQANYGLHFDNFIGTLSQKNDPHHNWVSFFVEKRLRPQLGLAYYKGLANETLLQQAEQFYQKLPNLLPCDAPALLHGDLWSGNVVSNAKGKPALIDPAVYYGNREVELAFTHLFGGFETAFYQAYNANMPLLPDFEERVPIYQLYPLLVHANLFGQSYLRKAAEIIQRYL
jgi:protein-ribulosamine 3-kinase